MENGRQALQVGGAKGDSRQERLEATARFLTLSNCWKGVSSFYKEKQLFHIMDFIQCIWFKIRRGTGIPLSNLSVIHKPRPYFCMT